MGVLYSPMRRAYHVYYQHQDAQNDGNKAPAGSIHI